MAGPERNTLITDGEGPLVFKDIARDISRKLAIEKDGQRLDGQQFFDILSMFNAFIHETGIRPTQPGDTLAFLVPHLLARGITDEDLSKETLNTQLANGVEAYLSQLREDGWRIRIISSAYNALWDTLGPRLGFKIDEIAATNVDLESLRESMPRGYDELIKQAEEFLLSRSEQIESAQQAFRNGMPLEDIFESCEGMIEIADVLDNLYFRDLPCLGFNPLEATEVIGGSRKVEALMRFARDLEIDPGDLVYVGDSITDDAVNKFLRDIGGLPIAINGDHYALRNARIAVATTDMRRLRSLLDAFSVGGLEGALSFASSATLSVGKERPVVVETETRIHIMEQGQDLLEVINVHREFRNRIRGASTSLI